MVVDSSEHWHIEVVSCENLRRNEYCFMLVFWNLRQVLLDLVDVEGRNPRISVDDGDQDLIGVDCVFVEKLVEMLRAPGHV